VEVFDPNYLSFYKSGADRTQNKHLNGSSVVVCVSFDTGMRVYQTVVQQRSIPRRLGNHVFIPKQRLGFLNVYNVLPSNGSFAAIVSAGT
jgi:hypothetical protein